MPEGVIAPCEEGLVGIRIPIDQLPEPRQITRPVRHALDEPGGQIPVLRGDDLVPRQQRDGQVGMQVRIDEPRQQHLVAKRLIDLVVELLKPRFERFHRADGHDPVVSDGHGRRGREGRVHRDDPASRIDRQLVRRGARRDQNPQRHPGDRQTKDSAC